MSTSQVLAEAWAEEESKERKNSEVELYDPQLLKGLDLSMCPTTFNPPISINDPGEGLMMRPLSLGDFHRGFLPLLSQLTTVGEVAEEQWQKRFNRMLSMQDTYLVTVIEDTTTGQVVGSATLVVEDKFIHNCGRVGRVEDVVVSKEVRGRQLGKLLLATLTLLARKQGCYKVTLNCADPMVKFYNGFGFLCEEGDANFMALRL